MKPVDPNCRNCNKPLPFPLATKRVGPKELVKVITDFGSTTVANDVAVEFIYNQWIDGAKKVRIVLPDGKSQDRVFRTKNKVVTGVVSDEDFFRGREKLSKIYEGQDEYREDAMPERDDRGVPVSSWRRHTSRRVGTVEDK